MKRRSFLKSATLAGAAGSLPLVFAPLAQASAPRFVLRRASAAMPGAPYLPLEVSPCTACSADTLRVRMDGLHLAAHSNLREFALSALFDVDAAANAPFLAWQYAAAGGRTSQRFGFVAGRASMRGFELEYRHAGETVCRRETCALTRLDVPLLAPGHYVLVDAAAPAVLAHSGDPRAPLAERGFDHLAFRIEPLS
jgi:hypothetical protein